MTETWTPAQAREYFNKGKTPPKPIPEHREPIPEHQVQARVEIERDDPLAGANKLERRYAAYLEGLREAGLIAAWRYEPLRFILAKRLTYTPDFLVIRHDGLVEIHETKGFWRDDARVKIKMAAKLHPYITFRAVQEKGRMWVHETITTGADQWELSPPF